MNAKIIVAAVLGWLAVPFTVLGLIDPLEGGVALLVALAIYGLVYWLSRQRPPRLLWWPFAAAVVIGVVAVTIAIFQGPMGEQVESPAAAATNPLLANAVLRVLMVLYRVADALAIVGSGYYAIQLTKIASRSGHRSM